MDRYFKAGPEFLAHIESVKAAAVEASNLAKQLAASIGAELAVTSNSRLSGFTFEQAPNNVDWCKPQYTTSGAKFYSPRRTSKTGRALCESMAAIRFPGLDEVLGPLRLNGWMQIGESTSRGFRMLRPSVETVAGVTLVIVPKDDERQYKGHKWLSEITLADYYELKATEARRDAGNKAIVDLVCGADA